MLIDLTVIISQSIGKSNHHLKYILALSLSCVQLFVTPWTVAHQSPLSMGIIQTRILEQVAMPSSRGSSQPGIKPRSSALQADSLPAEPQEKSKNTGLGSLYLLQWIFTTQESNQGLLHCRRIYLPTGLSEKLINNTLRGSQEQ